MKLILSSRNEAELQHHNPKHSSSSSRNWKANHICLHNCARTWEMKLVACKENKQNSHRYGNRCGIGNIIPMPDYKTISHTFPLLITY